MTKTKRVTVLMGGISSERVVSLSSGASVAKALTSLGYSVQTLDVGANLIHFIETLTAQKPDVVFNALHGPFGEDGCIQGVLDWLNIPYTHSGVKASATAINKAAARSVFIAAGIPVAKGRVIDVSLLAAEDPLPCPYIIKPLREGSSVGLSIVYSGSNTRNTAMQEWCFGETALVEEYIPGREISISVMADHALAITEIIPCQGHPAVYDYTAKYAVNGSRHILPASIDPSIANHAMNIAVTAHHALGCSGASRSDFRLDDTQKDQQPRLVLLEVNTQPGMTETSLLPEQAAYCGISYPELCEWLITQASCRQ